MKLIFTLQQSQLIINNQLLKVSDQLGERDHPLHRLHDEIRQNNLGHLLQRRLALRLQQHPELLLNIQVDRIVLPRMIKRHAQPINKRLLVTRQLIGQQINAVRAHTLPRLSLCLRRGRLRLRFPRIRRGLIIAATSLRYSLSQNRQRCWRRRGRLIDRLKARLFGKWHFITKIVVPRVDNFLSLLLASIAVLLVAFIVRQHPLGLHANKEAVLVATVLADLARSHVHFTLAYVRALVVLEAALLDGSAKKGLAGLARDAAEVGAC